MFSFYVHSANWECYWTSFASKQFYYFLFVIFILQGKHRPARCDSLEKKLFDLAAKARKESQKWQTTTTSKKRKLLTPKN